ncbi:hypothetical protein BaRGS_00029041, partial [Batillaria attramentaria]
DALRDERLRSLHDFKDDHGLRYEPYKLYRPQAQKPGELSRLGMKIEHQRRADSKGRQFEVRDPRFPSRRSKLSRDDVCGQALSWLRDSPGTLKTVLSPLRLGYRTCVGR